MNPNSTAPKSGLSVGEKACWWMVLIGAAMVAAPFLGPDYFSTWNGGQFAMALLGMVIGPSAFISSFLFRRRRLVRDAIFDDSKVLVKWTYAESEWKSYTEEDYLRETAGKWALFRVVAIICAVIGGGVAVADWKGGGPVVLGVLLGLCAVIAVVVRLTTSAQRKHRLANHAGQVRIGEEGLWLAGELHVWKGWGARMERCGVIAGQPPCIEFVYSTPAKNQRQINSVRVPIPTGFDAEAAGVVAHFVEKLAAPS